MSCDSAHSDSREVTILRYDQNAFITSVRVHGHQQHKKRLNQDNQMSVEIIRHCMCVNVFVGNYFVASTIL